MKLLPALFRVLGEPSARDLDLNDPNRIGLHQRLVAKKPFLRRIYREWYRWLSGAIPDGPDAVLELGAAGGGFLEEFTSGCICSDVMFSQNLDAVVDGQHLPFRDRSLRAISMTNVFHHLSEPALFLHDAARCIRTGGVVVMIEPWCTSWSRFVYHHLHHEAIDDTSEWTVDDDGGPMTGANAALPWIVFERDRNQFQRTFPEWRIDVVEPFMPLRYLVSGGLSMRALAPAWSFGLWRWFESALSLTAGKTAMFARIRLERKPDATRSTAKRR